MAVDTPHLWQLELGLVGLSGDMTDVLSDLQDLEEDLTECFTLSPGSSDESVRSSSHSLECNISGEKCTSISPHLCVLSYHNIDCD